MTVVVDDLIAATKRRDVGAVEVLLDRDPALAGACSTTGETPAIAAHFRHLPVVELLLSRGADVNVRSQNSHANTALHAAAAGGADRALVQRLVQAGVDFHATQGGGYTGLHEAASIGRADLVTLLLEAGAAVEPRTDEGRTAAELARANGHEDVAAMLASWRGRGGGRS